MDYADKQQEIVDGFRKELLGLLEDWDDIDVEELKTVLITVKKMRPLWKINSTHCIMDEEETANFFCCIVNCLETSIAALVALFPGEGWEVDDFLGWH